MDEWITMALWLHGNQVVANGGIGHDLLAAADCLDADTLETLVRIGSILAELQADKRKRDMENR